MHVPPQMKESGDLNADWLHRAKIVCTSSSAPATREAFVTTSAEWLRSLSKHPVGVCLCDREVAESGLCTVAYSQLHRSPPLHCVHVECVHRRER